MRRKIYHYSPGCPAILVFLLFPSCSYFFPLFPTFPSFSYSFLLFPTFSFFLLFPSFSYSFLLFPTFSYFSLFFLLFPTFPSFPYFFGPILVFLVYLYCVFMSQILPQTSKCGEYHNATNFVVNIKMSQIWPQFVAQNLNRCKVK